MGDRDSPRRRTGKKPMKTSVAAALAGLAMASTPTLGADLFGSAPPPMTFPASQSPITEVGTNWYLRGDIGFERRPGAELLDGGRFACRRRPGILPFSSTLGSSSWRDDVSADIGLGYRFNNWLRFEGAYEYRTAGRRQGRDSDLPSRSTWIVPDATARVRSTGTNTLHRRPKPQASATRPRWPAPISISAITGASRLMSAAARPQRQHDPGKSASRQLDGTPTSAHSDRRPHGSEVWQSPTGEPSRSQTWLRNQNWNRSFSSTHYSMAGALMAGFGFQFRPSATLDIGYQYLNAGTTTL